MKEFFKSIGHVAFTCAKGAAAITVLYGGIRASWAIMDIGEPKQQEKPEATA